MVTRLITPFTNFDTSRTVNLDSRRGRATIKELTPFGLKTINGVKATKNELDKARERQKVSLKSKTKKIKVTETSTKRPSQTKVSVIEDIEKSTSVLDNPLLLIAGLVFIIILAVAR